MGEVALLLHDTFDRVSLDKTEVGEYEWEEWWFLDPSDAEEADDYYEIDTEVLSMAAAPVATKGPHLRAANLNLSDSDYSVEFISKLTAGDLRVYVEGNARDVELHGETGSHVVIEGSTGSGWTISDGVTTTSPGGSLTDARVRLTKVDTTFTLFVDGVQVGQLTDVDVTSKSYFSVYGTAVSPLLTDLRVYATTPSTQQIRDLAVTARKMFKDDPVFFQHVLTTSGQDLSYELPVTNIQSGTLTVVLDDDNPGTSLTVNTDYTIDNDNGWIKLVTGGALSELPAAGISIFIEGYHYEWFSESSLEGYVEISLDRYQQSEGLTRFTKLIQIPVYADTMATAGLVEALWGLLSEAARTIDVISPETNIPASQRFRQLMQLIEFWEEDLKKKEEALNLGLYKILVHSMRRVSYRTGKLVPLYKAQEFDDQSEPERLHPPIDPIEVD